MQIRDGLRPGGLMFQESLLTRSLAIGQLLMSLGFLMVGITQKPGMSENLWHKVVGLLGLCMVLTSLIWVRKNPRFSFVALSVAGFFFVYMSNWVHDHVLQHVDEFWKHVVFMSYMVGMVIMLLSVVRTVGKLCGLIGASKSSLS
jgi:hypothetical protein